MRISVICFSLTGLATGERLVEGLKKQGCQAEIYKKSRYLEGSVRETTQQWAGTQFEHSDAIIFVGACGIAVRSISPWIQNKKADPAVLVIDECGHFVISLLSGHLGGANALAEKAAGILSAVPVITTATDLHNRFAVDVFAKNNGCALFHMDAARETSAAILAGEPVGFCSEFPWEGKLPEGLILCSENGEPVISGHSRPRVGAAVTVHKERNPFEKTVHIVPRTVVLGMGCRKYKEAEALYDAAISCVNRQGLYPEAIKLLASIDIKKEEPGLKALSQRLGIPFCTFTGEQLLSVQGDFTRSSFVKEITGVDSVCERSAVLASGQGKLIEKKHAGNGITTAMAVIDWRIHFE